ncbi:MAG: rhamnulokinase, partial [Muribaculaceae bacterium]|nr:rhamnulokinase [Muribaculaceae bacterium]
MSKVNYFAVDLGATSGRTILFTIEDGKISQQEITRFKNRIIENRGHYHWDIFALYYEILQGLKVMARDEVEIKSIGIDTWGVDF